MRRWDGTRIWYPNVKLGAMPLLNMSRSDAKVELFKVNLLSQSSCCTFVCLTSQPALGSVMHESRISAYIVW